MASNKLKVQAFRANDLSEDTGKQFELGRSWCDFLEIADSIGDVNFILEFKPISKSHESLKGRQIELRLSGLTPRKDRKAYANGSHSGHSAIKEFFLEDLHLTSQNNSSDYFAIYKASEFNYYLYYIPKLLHDNFIRLFESITPTVTISSTSDKKNNGSEFLQQIFYGAPGTGKSNEIKKVTKDFEKEGRVFRTTFHPDSDYSTFVGCYKPTKSKSQKQQRMNLSLEDLAKELGSYYSNEELGKIAGIQKFCFEYFPYIDGEYMSVNITKLLELAGVPKDYNVEINKYIKFCHLFPKQDLDKITYEFIPQAFTNAYTAAWNTTEDIYLIIEEINRGNCAQIFGDLFQLLDRRDDGFSEYPIDADNDLANYFVKELENSTRTDFPDGVKDGKKLVLPSNLYIWATMNTSDQSLFPIDSAFKRRWDWKYIPISNAKKNYVIEVDGDQYDWWSFLETINSIIENITHSEDKKLGYFFAKAKDKIISVDTFVSKVIFYLWNDVFKDNECSHKAFNDNGELLAFHKFFNDDGSVNTNVVIKFLQDLDVDPFENTDDNTTPQDETTPNERRERDKSRYVVNGKEDLKKSQMTREAFRLYIDTHPDADAQSIVNAWNGLGLKNDVRHLVETEEEFIERTKNSADPNKRAVMFELSNNEKIYLSTQFGIGNIGRFIDAVNNANWNIRIEKMPN